MFVSSYAMVDIFAHVYFSINKIYMAALMSGLMGLINVFLMGDMYETKKLRNVLLAVSMLFVVLPLAFMRMQVFVGNRSFLRSMIPHHSSAILMCQEANITEPEIEDLCKNIIEVQKEEIDIMEGFLQDL